MNRRLPIIVLLIAICLLIALPTVAQDADGVTLTESSVTWQTIAYELNDDNSMVFDSVDPETIIEHTFTTYILENEYLRVTLIPEYGARILSIIYKPTGHEQLYQNPLGTPFGVYEGNFLYDWLMVYGGIFPTFPTAEHGKTWLLPWDMEIVTETPETVSIRMSFVDDVDFRPAPQRFRGRPSFMEMDFTVTLHAGQAALDTEIAIRNPTDRVARYEYWTCVTFAPGTVPGDTRLTGNSEIIAPVDLVKMPPWWPDTTAQEVATDTRDVYEFDALRLFENWPDQGIAYAYPNLGDVNFWGVINQDNAEGLIRISDNDVSLGMKMWTWGERSLNLTEEDYPYFPDRPYIELWAGVSPEFFTSARLEQGDEIRFTERYVPTVDLTNVTHAADSALVDFHIGETYNAVLSVINTQPERPLTAIITADGTTIAEAVVSGTDGAVTLDTPIPADAGIMFALIDPDGQTVLDGTFIIP